MDSTTPPGLGKYARAEKLLDSSFEFLPLPRPDFLFLAYRKVRVQTGRRSRVGRSLFAKTVSSPVALQGLNMPLNGETGESGTIPYTISEKFGLS